MDDRIVIDPQIQHGKPVIPNPHQGDISRDLMMRILRQAGVEREEWERL